MSVEKHSKVYADAASALHGVVKDGMTLDVRRLRRLRHT